MKKAVSIFLVLLLLFNGLGFYGLLRGWEYKTTLDLVKRLDKQQYSKDETINIQIPFSLPYQLNSNGYERVDGQIEYEGEIYRLVKQKLERDTLFIVCIKDHASTQIQETLEDYVKTFTDKPSHGKNTAKSFVAFMKDFLPTSIIMASISGGWNYTIVLAPVDNNFASRSLAVSSPPPQS